MQHARLMSQASAGSPRQYMAMVLDRASFFFRYEDIYSFESVVDLNTEIRSGQSSGIISLSGRNIPVYCFDDELNPLLVIPDSRSVCVIMRDFSCGILCRETRILNASDVVEYDVPECMRHANMPIAGICMYKVQNNMPDQSAMLVSSEGLEKFINKINGKR